MGIIIASSDSGYRQRRLRRRNLYRGGRQCVVWLGTYFNLRRFITNFSMLVKVSSRLSNWRNAFSTAAAQAVQQFFKDNATELDTPNAIADAVDTYLSYQGPSPQHRVFWWRTWNVDEDNRIVKKVRFITIFVINYLSLILAPNIPGPPGYLSESTYSIYARACLLC